MRRFSYSITCTPRARRGAPKSVPGGSAAAQGSWAVVLGSVGAPETINMTQNCHRYGRVVRAIGSAPIGIYRNIRTPRRTRKSARPSLLVASMLSTTPGEYLVSVGTTEEAVAAHRFSTEFPLITGTTLWIRAGAVSDVGRDWRCREDVPQPRLHWDQSSEGQLVHGS